MTETEREEWNLSLKVFLSEHGITDFSLPLFTQAFTHRSHFNENGQDALGDNERLEYLGDSVLGLVLTDLLVRQFPEDSEGRLSKKRAFLVSEPSLNIKATELGLQKWLLLGRGDEMAGTRSNSRILSSVLEALIGAIYLDQGWEKAFGFVEDLFQKEIDLFGVVQEDHLDFKTRLQEIVQKEYRKTPTYQTLREEGPEHLKTFEVAVYCGEEKLGDGKGPSKKLAEQNAAKNALSRKEDQ